jgi:DNA-binding CsgD family transcriptional regulator
MQPGTLHPSLTARPWIHWALGLLDLSRGHLDSALTHLETTTQGPTRHHAPAPRAIPDLVETAARLGQPQRAAKPLARLTRWAQYADTPSTDALVERCLALLTPGEHAEQHYLAALKLHDESFEQARTQLLYGAWLRRTRRKADARAHLRAAVDSLDRTGATPWAQHAQAELDAATTRPPDPTRPPHLTPQELQVTRLAAQGLSNRDIAAQRFLSSRTVGYYLYKAYPKLGITSRNQLNPHAPTP